MKLARGPTCPGAPADIWLIATARNGEHIGCDGNRRRNFRDYFGFESGAASQRGLSKETAAAIKAWMEANPERKNPWLR